MSYMKRDGVIINIFVSNRKNGDRIGLEDKQSYWEIL